MEPLACEEEVMAPVKGEDTTCSGYTCGQLAMCLNTFGLQKPGYVYKMTMNFHTVKIMLVLSYGFYLRPSQNEKEVRKMRKRECEYVYV